MSSLSQFAGPDKNPLQLGVVHTLNVYVKIGTSTVHTSDSPNFITAIQLSGVATYGGANNSQYYTILDTQTPGYLTHVISPYLSSLGTTSIRLTIDGQQFTVSKTHTTGRLLLGAFDYNYLISDSGNYNSNYNNLSSTSGFQAFGFSSGGTGVLSQQSTVIIPPPVVLARRMANIKFNKLKIEMAHSVELNTSYSAYTYGFACFVQ